MKINYNMTRDYRSHWSTYDAIREMVQNAQDAGECEAVIHDRWITITTKHHTIPLETLMLGESQKSNGSVGRYGEGYKIGMMILEREGLCPTIHSGGIMMGAEFSKNELGLESFHMLVHDLEEPIRGTVFQCSLGGMDPKELVKRFPIFDKPLAKPSHVDVLPSGAGDIYVNGLWVCSKNLTFSYNFHPDAIQLNTDRNMVEGVAWQLGKFWAETDHPETLFKLLENGANDVSDVYYHLHDAKLKAELTRLFYNKYGDGAKIAKPGNSYFSSGGTVALSASASRLFIKCGVSEAARQPDPTEPFVILEGFLTANKNKLRRDTKQQLHMLIEKAKGWRKPEVF